MTARILDVQHLINSYKELAGRVVVLYHANCVDGYVSQLTVRTMLGDFDDSPNWQEECPVDTDFNQVESIADSGNRYIPVQYEYTDVEWLKLIETIIGRDVIIVDFSPTIKILKLLSRQCRTVLVIDHHKTTATKCAEIMAANTLDIIKIRGLNDLSHRDLTLLDEPDEDYMPTSDFENTLVIFEPEMCSAKMCWILSSLYTVPEAYAHKDIGDLIDFRLERLPDVYKLTDDYDRYILSDCRSKPLQAYLHHQMYFGPLEEWYNILTSSGRVREELFDQGVEQGRLLVQAKDKEITTIIKRNAKPVVVDDVVFIAVNASSSLINEIGERISNETGGPVMIWEERSGYTKVSLRSSAKNGNFDVGAFAETKGGGGHRNAASYIQKGLFDSYQPGLNGDELNLAVKPRNHVDINPILTTVPIKIAPLKGD